MATRRKPAKQRNPKRKPGSRPTNVTTRDERAASLRWSRNDAHEALTAALSMGDWAGVAKYAKQVAGFESKLSAVEGALPRRHRLSARSPQTYLTRADEKRGLRHATAGDKYGRGRLP